MQIYTAVSSAGGRIGTRITSESRYVGGTFTCSVYEPPARETAASICIRNRGDRRVALYGAADRTNSRSQVRVDGQPVVPDFGIVFYEREPVSIIERLPTSIERATTFRGPLTEDLLWVLIVLFVVGTPLGVLLALFWSLRDET